MKHNKHFKTCGITKLIDSCRYKGFNLYVNKNESGGYDWYTGYIEKEADTNDYLLDTCFSIFEEITYNQFPLVGFDTAHSANNHLFNSFKDVYKSLKKIIDTYYSELYFEEKGDKKNKLREYAVCFKIYANDYFDAEEKTSNIIDSYNCKRYIVHCSNNHANKSVEDFLGERTNENDGIIQIVEINCKRKEV